MKETKNKQIKLVVSEKEYEQIRNNAKVCDKTVSAYIREVALNMCIMQHDYSCVTEHTKAITSCKNAIVDLVFTIIKRGTYTPPDLEYIANKINEMLKSEKEFLNLYGKSVESGKRLIVRTVRKVVKENIGKDK